MLKATLGASSVTLQGFIQSLRLLGIIREWSSASFAPRPLKTKMEDEIEDGKQGKWSKNYAFYRLNNKNFDGFSKLITY